MKQEKERILKLVEEGKLTAQEALTLIEKLDSDYKEKEEKSQRYQFMYMTRKSRLQQKKRKQQAVFRSQAV